MKSIDLMDKGQQIELVVNGAVLCVISKEVLKSLLGTDKAPKVKKVLKKSAPSKAKNSDLIIKAMQLVKAYAKLRKEHFRSKNLVLIEKGDPNFKHFLRAVEIMERNECKNYMQYLKAQKSGLSYLKTFIQPSHLSSLQAENRFLEYQKSFKDENGDVVEIEVSNIDRSTPLTENSKYMFRRSKVLNGTSSLEETVYVQRLQILRKKGRVDQYVLDRLDELGN